MWGKVTALSWYAWGMFTPLNGYAWRKSGSWVAERMVNEHGTSLWAFSVYTMPGEAILLLVVSVAGGCDPGIEKVGLCTGMAYRVDTALGLEVCCRWENSDISALASCGKL